MPLLRSLTTKLKTKLTISPPSSPTTGSPSSSTSSFENMGGERKSTSPQSQRHDTAHSTEGFGNKRPQSQRANTGSSELSFGCVGVDARDVMEEMAKVRLAREERRRSKFREEF